MFPHPLYLSVMHAVSIQMKVVIYALFTFGFIASSAAQTTPHRGVWFWNTTKVGGVDSPHSSKFVVGPSSSAAEDEAIAFMSAQGIKEVYGSYLHRPRDVPDEIWPWNAKLDAAGIDSQLLISGFEPDDPTPLTDPTHSALVTKVTDRLIDFNDDAPSAAAKFDALHLDLEPQTLDAWSVGTGAHKRVFLDNLLDAYIDIRAALDAGGYGSLPIYADIPFSWDKIPGSIAWVDATDRDNWYTAIGNVLDGISVMTFSKDTLPDLASATDYERTGPFILGGGTVHVAVQPKVGPGEIWPTYPAFQSVTEGLETAYGEAHLENYAFWRHAHADFGPSIGGGLPWLEAGPVLVSEVSGSGGVIIFTGVPGYLYTIKQSEHPGEEGEPIGTFRTRGMQGREELSVRVDYGDRKRAFWVVTEEANGAGR